MKEWDVYVCGDINVDLVVPGVEKLPEMGTEAFVPRMETFVGGGAALFALGTGKLGLRTVFQGSVGGDLYGHFIRETLKRCGVDDRLLEVRENTGTGISISFTGTRDRCFLTYPGTNGELDMGRINLEMVKKARHTHMTGYTDRNHEAYLKVLRAIRDMGDVTVSLDLGWDESGNWYPRLPQLLPLVDILLMNETECLHTFRCEKAEDGARKAAEDAGLAVVKTGSRGSLAVKHGQVETARPFPVIAVDTTGAGDSFNAGFISAWLRNMPLQACLERGNACGALSVTALGGNTAFPDREGLEDFLRKGMGT